MKYTWQLRLTRGGLFIPRLPLMGPFAYGYNIFKKLFAHLISKAKEVGKPEQRNEPLFGVDVKQYSNKVDFVQLVKGNAKTSVTGKVEFMVCNDKMCLPPAKKEFSLPLN